MKVLITCRECGHQAWGRSENPFMNKVQLFNHVRRAHPTIRANKLHLVMKTTFPYQLQEYR